MTHSQALCGLAREGLLEELEGLPGIHTEANEEMVTAAGPNQFPEPCAWCHERWVRGG